GASNNEQDVGGVELNEILMRMLASTLRWYCRDGTFEDLQQCLLNAFTGNVSGDRRVLAPARNLVDLVNVDNAGFGLLDSIVSSLEQLEEDIFNVLTHVPGFCQARSIGDCERNVQLLRQRLRQVRLTATGRPDEHDVGLRDFHII